MRILYLSVHQVLEYDELRMFCDAGHEVFSLGAYFASPPLRRARPPLDLGPSWPGLKAAFEAQGGRFAFEGDPKDFVIPAAFVDRFDVCIVMHDPRVFAHHWPVLSRIPVIWRTIGVDVFGADRQMAAYRKRGCHVVRYSPLERGIPGSIGADAVIRFPKKLADFAPWSGTERVILKFYSDFKRRFPAEHDFVERLAQGRPFRLGGIGNAGEANAIGLVPYERQLELLRDCRVYFYGAGPPAPYTLNFMEAWLAGIPVVVLKPDVVYGAGHSRFTEIPGLVTHGQDAFLVDSVEEAGAICDRLFADHDFARSVGAAGAAKAASLFRDTDIAAQWNAVLRRVTSRGMIGRLRRWTGL